MPKVTDRMKQDLDADAYLLTAKMVHGAASCIKEFSDPENREAVAQVPSAMTQLARDLQDHKSFHDEHA
eukprot:709335-Pyramimonas_sp.AAC.2